MTAHQIEVEARNVTQIAVLWGLKRGYKTFLLGHIRAYGTAAIHSSARYAIARLYIVIEHARRWGVAEDRLLRLFTRLVRFGAGYIREALSAGYAARGARGRSTH